MQLKDIVTTLKTSNQLKKFGFNKKSIFSYYENEQGHSYLSETDASNDEFVSYAYTSSELISYLPERIIINLDTYVVDGKHYKQLERKDLVEHEYADLVTLKDTINGKAFYVTKYSINGRVIALSQNLKGQYNNLIRFGDNEAESRGDMILALIEEGILNFQAVAN